jgi:hypothetical protein
MRIAAAAMLLACAVAWAAGLLYWRHLAGGMRDEILDTPLERVICTLDRLYPSARLVVCGDSRAERQLIPRVMEEELGAPAVNMGSVAIDLVTMYNAIERYGLADSSRVFLVSIGVYQVNDAVTNGWYLSPAAFFNHEPLEHLLLFRSRPIALVNRYRTCRALRRRMLYGGGLFRCRDRRYIPDRTCADKGYRAIKRVWNGDASELADCRWYWDGAIDGIRWRLYARYLRAFDSLHVPVVLLKSPAAPSVYTSPHTARFIAMERAFSEQLHAACEDLRYVRLLDLSLSPAAGMTDSMYYDGLHCNIDGARVYSKLVSQKLRETGLFTSRR